MGAVVTDGVGSVVVIRDGVPSLSTGASAEAGVYTKIREPLPAYEGDTAVTPTDTEQVLHTAGKTVYEDITINPIPQNYGLITWNGSTLTVS